MDLLVDVVTEHPKIYFTIKDVFAIKKSQDENTVVLVEKVEIGSPGSNDEVGCILELSLHNKAFIYEYLMVDSKLYSVCKLDKDSKSYVLFDQNIIDKPINIMDLIDKGMSEFLSEGKSDFTIINGVLLDGYLQKA